MGAPNLHALDFSRESQEKPRSGKDVVHERLNPFLLYFSTVTSLPKLQGAPRAWIIYVRLGKTDFYDLHFTDMTRASRSVTLKPFTSIMAYHLPFHTVGWVVFADVLGNALLWFQWLYRFSSKSGDQWFNLSTGGVTLVLSTGIVGMLLVFGQQSQQEHFDGRAASFWIGTGCTIYTCLGATSMV